MRVTLKEVAKAAEVSIAAASRVLNGRGLDEFSHATCIRIRQTAQRLGYRPNPLARALVTGRTRLVTLWIWLPYRAFSGMVIEEVEKQVRQHGYGLLVGDVSLREPDGPQIATSAWSSDGVLVMDGGRWAQEILRARPSPETPIVSMGTDVIPGVDAVRMDLRLAFREAAEHLADRGCRRIAYFYYRPSFPIDTPGLAPMYSAPLEAYRAVMRERKLDETCWPLEIPSRAAARGAVVERIRQDGPPDAILCRNDDLAIGSYRALCDLGLAVGDDVLIVGCDGIQDTQFLHCPLSTIILPVAQMCDQAWQFLDARMAAPTMASQQATLQGSLLIRESSERAKKATRRRKPKKSVKTKPAK